MSSLKKNTAFVAVCLQVSVQSECGKKGLQVSPGKGVILVTTCIPYAAVKFPRMLGIVSAKEALIPQQDPSICS